MRPVQKSQPPYLPEVAASNRTAETEVVHHALIDALGNYCSYCEMPLSDYHIEHLRNVAEWPAQVSLRQWDDLLLICNDCRAHIRTPVLTDLSAATLLWPDRDPTFALQNSPLQYELRPVTYVVLDDGERVSAETVELVFVVANPEAGTLLYQKAFNTIAHFQLNMQLEYYDEATNELRIPLDVHQQRLDNRMFKRTKAWRDAHTAVDRLLALEEALRSGDAAQGGNAAAALQAAFIDQIAMTAWFSGNWSVWMTVFYQRTEDISLLQTAFAGDTHVFAGLDRTTAFGLDRK